MIRTKQELFSAISKNENLSISEIDTELLNDKDVIKGLIAKKSEGSEIEIPKECFTDEMVSYALERSIENFKFIPESYRYDSEFVSKLSLIGEDLLILKYTSQDILANKSFILSFLEKERKNLDSNHIYQQRNRSPLYFDPEADSLYYYLEDNLKSDIEIIKAFQKISPGIFKNIPSKFRQNISICRQFIYELPSNYKYVDIEVKKDKKLAKDVCNIHGSAFQYIKDFFCNDIEIAEIVLSKYGLALEYFSNEIRNNKRMVELAVNSSSGAFKYASKQLRGDIEIVKKAISKDGFNLEFVSEELRNDLEIVKIAINHNKSANGWGSKSCGGAFKFASQSILSDKKLALTALQNEGSFGIDGFGGDHLSEKPLYSFLPDSLKKDIEIATTAININSKCIPFLIESVLENEKVLKLIKEIKSEEDNKQKGADLWGNSDWS